MKNDDLGRWDPSAAIGPGFPLGHVTYLLQPDVTCFFGWKLHSWYRIYSNSCKDCMRFIGNHSGRNPKRLNSDLFREKRGPGFEFQWLRAPQWITDIDHPSWMTWIIDFAWIIKWAGEKTSRSSKCMGHFAGFPLSCQFFFGLVSYNDPCLVALLLDISNRGVGTGTEAP